MKEFETGFVHCGQFILKAQMADGELRELSFTDEAEHGGTPQPEMAVVLEQLRQYFAGSRKGFTVKLHLEGTEFQKKVWQALLTIPYGETRSYKEIAIQIGRPKAFRAVGGAIHNNPIGVIVPCHRVIGSDGSLTGYAGGLHYKEFLLALEQRGREKA